MSKHPVINTQVGRPYQRSSHLVSESGQQQQDVTPADIKQQLRAGSDSTLYEQEEHAEQDDLDDEEDDEEDDDDSTFTSSPSIPDENINFDLVYALHTFVATVEGQASVFKGDSLTLLDDSNSYWWLVSVLKTSEVGYIPAENIETPFERLARLNKHRNVEVTALDQAVHYISQESRKPKAGAAKRQVTLSKDLSVQAQIILLGDDGEQQVGEAYEEWEESMGEDDDDDDEESIDEKEERATATAASSGVAPGQQEPHRSLQHSDQESSTAAASPVAQQQQPLADSNTAASLPSTASAPATNAPAPATDSSAAKQPPTTAAGSFWRLFSRGKKDIANSNGSMKPGSVIPARVSSEDADSGSISSLASSVMSEDKAAAARNSQQSSATNNSQLAVLRVFAGNVNVGAMYHSMLVDENTSAEQLLIQAMERFHIAQIEDKTAGRSSSRAITPTNGSGVEYYLTVKPMSGDEVTLASQDKPLAIFRSMTDQLTTPMPSLAHVKKFSQQLASTAADNRRSTVLRQRQHQRGAGEDSIIRFYLHKRIRRVNEREGQIYVKVSLYTEPRTINSMTSKHGSGNSTIPSAFSAAKSLRRKKVEPCEAARERIDKLIAVSSTVTIADLTEIALDKFHIIPHGDTDHYRMAVSTQHTQDKPLNPSSKLIEVIHDDAPGARDNSEKLFVLRKTHHTQSRSASREAKLRTAQGSQALSEHDPSRADGSNLRTPPLPVSQFDSKTSDILQRVDAALEQLGRGTAAAAAGAGSQQQPAPSMAVARNPEGGVDMVMTHGALISKPQARNQTQYSLLAKMVDEDKLCLVTQKLIQLPGQQRAISIQLKNVTEQDLDALVRFATTYLDTHDRKVSRKPVSARGGQGADGEDDPNSAPSLDVFGGSNGQMSSMDDLEKEFQRIIAAHAF